jgi:hypothetical protein
MNGGRQNPWLARVTALGLSATLGCSGCQLYHNLGTGVRYDPPVDRPVSDKSKRVRDILLEVTTNAAGAVTTVQFKRSSGSPDIDKYVADSARTNWAGGPSTRSVIELTYSGEKGFSDPKLISTSPAPQ